MKPLKLDYYTFTSYDKTFNNVNVFFETEDLKNTIGEYVSALGLSQLRAAETEKYPHVTFFLSGGREKPFQKEERIMVNSPKVATYDLQPEMSALELTDSVKKYLQDNNPNLAIVNFANPDMVGHTGVMEAIKIACKTTDSCAKELCNTALSLNYKIMIIADHGNPDFAINDDGTPNTAHSLNLVPCIVMGTESIKLKDGVLADVAPTLLKMMGLKKPKEMTGNTLY